MGDWNLDAVVDRLQDAALDATLWPDVLSDLSQRVGASGALLISQDSHFPGPPASPELKYFFEDYFKNGWNFRDDRYRGFSTLVRKGVTVDQDFISADERRRSDYYQDLIARHDLPWTAHVGFVADKDLWCLTIARNTAQEPFEPDEAKRLSAIWRPLNDAATLSRQLSFARVLGATDALELTRQPGILLDARGRVLALNSLAEDHVGDMIDVTRRMLIFRDLRSQSNFESVFASAAGDKTVEGPVPAVATVRDRRGQLVVIRAIALRGWARYTFTNARVLLLLGTREEPKIHAASLLSATFGLTPAETRLAGELCNGLSLAAAAGRLGVTYETARSSLKLIFSKTDTHHQSQLVALLAQFPLATPPPGAR